MRYSYIANEIVNEYNRKLFFEKKRRTKCKDTKCTECKYQEICEGSDGIGKGKKDR